VRLAVHATELVVAKAALRVGADILVHSVVDAPVDDEFIALAKSRNAIYCPTIFVFSSYALALSNQWKPTEAERRLADPEILAAMSDLDRIPKDKLPRAWPARWPSRRRSRLARPPAEPEESVDAGITVAMGTDAATSGRCTARRSSARWRSWCARA
jgi:imidazolonepropionase-like amidohydrolase